jgi:hypothetical protein
VRKSSCSAEWTLTSWYEGFDDSEKERDCEVSGQPWPREKGDGLESLRHQNKRADENKPLCITSAINYHGHRGTFGGLRFSCAAAEYKRLTITALKVSRPAHEHIAFRQPTLDSDA